MPKLTKADLDFVNSAPVQMKVDVEVNASPQQVWDLLIDTPGWVNWFEGVRSCEVTSAAFDGLGSTRRININGLRADEEMIGWEPSRLFAFTVVATNMWFARRWVEQVEIVPREDGGSLVQYATGLELLLLARPLRPIFERGIRQAWETSLPRIDAYSRG